MILHLGKSLRMPTLIRRRQLAIVELVHQQQLFVARYGLLMRSRLALSWRVPRHRLEAFADLNGQLIGLAHFLLWFMRILNLSLWLILPRLASRPACLLLRCSTIFPIEFTARQLYLTTVASTAEISLLLHSCHSFVHRLYRLLRAR